MSPCFAVPPPGGKGLKAQGDEGKIENCLTLRWAYGTLMRLWYNGSLLAARLMDTVVEKA